MTELNYQFLNTAAISNEEFRPAALPKDWYYSRQAREGYWLTKATEQAYDEFIEDMPAQRDYFIAKLDDPEMDITDRRRYRAQLIEKNFRFLFEPIYQKELQDKAEHILNKYRNANLLVAGDNRYLSDDLMRLLAVIVQPISEYAYPVCRLCRDHERAGFIEGVKVGIHLALELKVNPSERGMLPSDGS